MLSTDILINPLPIFIPSTNMRTNVREFVERKKHIFTVGGDPK